jgi:hypothetical protein
MIEALRMASDEAFWRMDSCITFCSGKDLEPFHSLYIIRVNRILFSFPSHHNHGRRAGGQARHLPTSPVDFCWKYIE